MNKADLEALFARLAPALDALVEPWCVIGSAAMLIGGLPIEDCPDLDIMTTEAGAAALELAWAAWRDPDYRPGQVDRFRSRFTPFAFPEGRAEVMGALEVNRGDGWRPVTMPVGRSADLGGRTIRVADRDEMIVLLTLFGRPKDLAKIALIEGA
ncbi:hypothetical protein [Caulobacter mirabilis]|uniref:Uncharacterized protein n=1 Tax=Caulobacter mirabilis TaxID=69666 RepID=A0A2D2AXA2_9CAUL|nr:hypothetical protein [Caulobacter mirabilis]ATQ42644.1 hypothetical protein CSW64_09600 [Caulobacter mirabilis]